MSDQGHEPEVELDAISASLDELVKAAEVTKAYGGVAIDTYGHVDERGKTSGSLVEGGDIGSLDSMMIGKMQAALIDAGFSADQVAAFMAGKQGEDEDEDDEMDGKFGKPADTSGGVGTNPRVRASGGSKKSAEPEFEKSMDQFRQDPDIKDAVDVSPYLEALTQRTAEQLDAIKKSMLSQDSRQNGVNRAMAVAVVQIGHLVKGMAGVVDEMGRRLNIVESQPAPQRGATTAPQAKSRVKALTKGMPGEAGAGAQGNQLHKGQVVSVLSYMNLEKGMRELNGEKTSEIISRLEASNLLTKETMQAVQGFLAANPGEARTALGYR